MVLKVTWLFFRPVPPHPTLERRIQRFNYLTCRPQKSSVTPEYFVFERILTTVVSPCVSEPCLFVFRGNCSKLVDLSRNGLRLQGSEKSISNCKGKNRTWSNSLKRRNLPFSELMLWLLTFAQQKMVPEPQNREVGFLINYLPLYRSPLYTQFLISNPLDDWYEDRTSKVTVLVI